MFCFSLKLLSEKFLVLGRIQQDINAHKSSCKIPVIRRQLLKNLQIPNFTKIRPVCGGGARFVSYVRTDGQIGRHDEANSRFPNFRTSLRT